MPQVVTEILSTLQVATCELPGLRGFQVLFSPFNRYTLCVTCVVLIMLIVTCPMPRSRLFFSPCSAYLFLVLIHSHLPVILPGKHRTNALKYSHSNNSYSNIHPHISTLQIIHTQTFTLKSSHVFVASPR